MKKFIKFLLAVGALCAAVLGLLVISEEKADTQYVTIYDEAQEN